MSHPAGTGDADRAAHHPSSYFRQYAQPSRAALVDTAAPRPTGWFVVTWLCCWPLAVYSLISAWSAIDRLLAAGDVRGARRQASRVRAFGIAALCLALAVALGVVIVQVAAYTARTSTCHDGRC